MPFVTEVWHVYALIVVINACSAGCTPAFQPMIPDVLRDEPTYARALNVAVAAASATVIVTPLSNAPPLRP